MCTQLPEGKAGQSKGFRVFCNYSPQTNDNRKTLDRRDSCGKAERRKVTVQGENATSRQTLSTSEIILKGIGCLTKRRAIGRYTTNRPETSRDSDNLEKTPVSGSGTPPMPQADGCTCWEAGSCGRFLPGHTLTPPHTGYQVLENCPVCRLRVPKTVKD